MSDKVTVTKATRELCSYEAQRTGERVPADLFPPVRPLYFHLGQWQALQYLSSCFGGSEVSHALTPHCVLWHLLMSRLCSAFQDILNVLLALCMHYDLMRVFFACLLMRDITGSHIKWFRLWDCGLAGNACDISHSAHVGTWVWM